MPESGTNNSIVHDDTQNGLPPTFKPERPDHRCEPNRYPD
jgi:hypothetical protein